MPFSGGNFSLSEPAYVAGQTMTAAIFNNNFSDIATNGLSLVMTLAGEKTMTAVMPLAAAGFTYGTDTNTGMYRSAADTQIIKCGGVDAVTITSSGLDALALSVAGTAVPSASSTTTFTNKTLTDPIINAAGGTIILPTSASPSQTAEGSVFWDSDDNLLSVGDGASRKIMVDTAGTQTLTNKAMSGASNTFSSIPISAVTGACKQADQQSFTSSGTWTKPSGFGAKAYALIEGWAAGAGGARSATAANAHGGGGGSYKFRWILLSSLGATETVTIGGGGAGRTGSAGSGSNGGNTTFGSLLTAYGGAGGQDGLTGRGGGLFAIGGNIITAAGGNGDYFIGGNGGGAGGAGGQSVYGGGAGSGGDGIGAGVSQFGGNGGAAGSNGTQPAGGGGGSTGNGGNGADGKCVVTIFDGA